MQNVNKWPLEHWHIELCSKCSLKCPRCSRQEVPEGLTNQELDLDWFKKNFSGIVKHVKKITFCGDDGDVIYAKDFLKILEWLNTENSDIQKIIITNGSYKTKDWWQKLSNLLDHKDSIHFSLDGWDQESNSIYRINCNWESILQGIDVLSKSATKPHMLWAAIAFKFNENNIEKMKDLATKLGFDSFQLTLSSKFGINYDAYPKDDPLQPSTKFISHGRFTRQFYSLSTSQFQDSTKDLFGKRYAELDQDENIMPLCKIGNKGLYLNAQGNFYPCCWTGLRYDHNKNIFDYIDRNQTLEQQMNNANWNQLFASMQDQSCPDECKSKCSAKLWSYEHATQW